MDLIIFNDGAYTLVEVTKEMLQNLKIYVDLDCFDLCDVVRLALTTYLDSPINAHVMNDGTGDFYGCICNS